MQSVDLLRAGAVATMMVREGGPGDKGSDRDSAALLTLTLGIEETQVSLHIGALRSALDVTSHFALIRTRTGALRQMRDEPCIVRPCGDTYRGRAKEWLRYACQWALAAVRRRRGSWRPYSISKAVKQGIQPPCLDTTLILVQYLVRDYVRRF